MGARIRNIFIAFSVFLLLVDSLTFIGLIQDAGFMGNPAVLLVYAAIPLFFIVGLLIYGRAFSSPEFDS